MNTNVASEKVRHRIFNISHYGSYFIEDSYESFFLNMPFSGQLLIADRTSREINGELHFIKSDIYEQLKREN